MKTRIRRRVKTRVRRRLSADAALLLVALTFVLPLAWVVLSSVDADANLRVKWPSQLTFGNFDDVLKPDITFTPLLNSLILCGCATALTVGCAALAAYPLSRYRSRLNNPFLTTTLFATCLPITAVMVPVYALFVQVNLIDTMAGTIYFFAASQLPFAVWLMKNFMDGVPKELEEAAWTDGANTFQGLVRIVLPLMGPGVAVVTVYSFAMMWGNFFVPFMLLLSPTRCRPRSASTTSSATGAPSCTGNSPRSPSSTRRPWCCCTSWCRGASAAVSRWAAR